MSDPINPDHYKRLPAEAIEIIEAAIANAPSKRAAYLHGQVLRYILRCWNKNGIEDLRKAKWFLDRLIGSFDTEQASLMDGLVAAWKPEDGKANQVYPEPKWTPRIGNWVKINKPTVTQDDGFEWRKEMDKYDGAIVKVKQLDFSAIVIDKLGFEFSWLEPAKAPNCSPYAFEVGQLVRVEIADDDADAFNPEAKALNGHTAKIVEMEWEEGPFYYLDNINIPFSEHVLKPAETPQQTTEPTLNSDKIPEGYRKLNDSSNEPRQPGDLRWSVAEKRYIPISGDELGYANRDNWAACRKITGEVTGEVTVEAKPPDGWRLLDRGEVIRKGDQGFENGLWYSIEPTMIGIAFQSHWRPILRRNKFNVGEKVVHVSDKPLIVYTVNGVRADGHVRMSVRNDNFAVDPKYLAPYIEDAK